MALSLFPDSRPRYQLGELIARGGMATVYEATDEHGRVFAAKIPHRSMTQSDVAMQRFLLEAQLLCTVRSPFIVRGHGLFRTDDQRPMLVMDRLHGEDLSVALQQMGQLPLQRAVLSVIHACTALAALHARDVIHRDLKPSNLYLTHAPDGLGATVLLDLGVVKTRAHDPRTAVTHSGCVVGSPAYMAPEQMLGQEDLDHRADIWSVGVLLYELLTGRVPFEGTNIMHVLSRALYNSKTPLRQLRGDVPVLVEEVVDRCLRVEPKERFASALDVARALLPLLPPWLARRVAEALPVAGEPPSGTYSLAAGASSFGHVK